MYKVYTVPTVYSVYMVQYPRPTVPTVYTVQRQKLPTFSGAARGNRGQKGGPSKLQMMYHGSWPSRPIPGKFCSTLAGIRSMPPTPSSTRDSAQTNPCYAARTVCRLPAGRHFCWLQKHIWLHDNISTTPEKGVKLGLHSCLQPFPKFSWWWRERLMQASG